jgi:hypothetical protein
MSDPTQEQPAVAPTVTTAPAGSPWSRIPAHLGKARTSTVVLSLLFLAIGTLYLNIRPDTPPPATAVTGDTVPAQPTAPAPETTATTTPETTPETTETSQDQPTTTAEPTTTEDTTPSETTGGGGSTTTVPEPTVPTATVPSPTG